MARAALSNSSEESVKRKSARVARGVETSRKVERTVFDVEEDKLGPKVSLFSSSDDLGKVGPAPEELEVLHD